MLEFVREVSHRNLWSPPRDPLIYMQIYYVLAHLGLGNNVFYRPDQQRPFQQPPGDPRRLPAPPRGPPRTPPGPRRNPTEKTRHFGLPGWPEARVLRPPSKPGSQSDRENAALRPPRVAGSTCFTAPEQTRVGIGPRKRGTLHGQVEEDPGDSKG